MDNRAETLQIDRPAVAISTISHLEHHSKNLSAHESTSICVPNAGPYRENAYVAEPSRSVCAALTEKHHDAGASGHQMLRNGMLDHGRKSAGPPKISRLPGPMGHYSEANK